jgi:two-component system CheB/CheR fusion protein
VRDNGAGIEPSTLGRIFELFVQGDRRTGRNRGGLGIGLTLAKRLVEMHGGTIEVHSPGTNQGSEFVVRLPLESPPDHRGAARPAKNVAAPRVAGRRGSDRRVLIIDDDTDGAEALSLLLRSAGHETEVAPDGETGVERAARIKPDVILVDIGLPDMDGYDVARELRKRPDARQALMIAVTGYGAEVDVRKSEEAGFDEHMTKPVNLDLLLARLNGRH